MDPIIPQIIAAIGIVLIPSIGLTARFALKPIVEAIVQLREAFPQGMGTAPQVEQRLAAVEEEVRQLREGFDRLATAVEFEVQLHAGAGPASRLPRA